MVSEKFLVNDDDGRALAARYAADDFALQAGLDRHNALRFTLLVEETLGMVKNMLDTYYGQMWFVCADKACEIHFEAASDMDGDKKYDLLSVSKTGKNEACNGFMAGIADMISRALHSIGRAADIYGQEALRYGVVYNGLELPIGMDAVPLWTLQTLRSNLADGQSDNIIAEEAWDELEKSIVANIADDVIVGIRGDRIELTIVKNFA